MGGNECYLRLSALQHSHILNLLLTWRVGGGGREEGPTCWPKQSLKIWQRDNRKVNQQKEQILHCEVLPSTEGAYHNRD